VHGAELVQDAGHGSFRRFVVKVWVKQISSLQRGGATQTLISVAGSGSEWIRIEFGRLDPNLGGQKKNNKNRKKVRKFQFWGWMFSFDGWMLLLKPRRPLRKPLRGINNLSKNWIFIGCKILKFLFINTLDPELDTHWTKNAGSGNNETNADLQHWKK
jgi:hypothetical protein